MTLHYITVRLAQLVVAPVERWFVARAVQPLQFWYACGCPLQFRPHRPFGLSLARGWLWLCVSPVQLPPLPRWVRERQRAERRAMREAGYG